jgi:DNA polymerase-3 subunit gamma/tau
MTYRVLARKYRPQAFTEVVDQEHVTRTLTNALRSDRVAHAMLFCGPRGTGKTTIARILAKALNCIEGPTPTPCNKCRSCEEVAVGNAVDVYEIDGASNNGVDHIRDLRENLKYRPAHSTYKIYIIDEVHMLSVPAFNALLKSLEEPPAHVLFLMATTEPQRIPVTILSRCQRHDLKRIAFQPLCDHLIAICQQEGVEARAETLGLIAQQAEGCVRDALSLLDRVLAFADQTIEHTMVVELLGVLEKKQLYALMAAVLARDVAGALTLVEQIDQRGHNLKEIFTDLTTQFRNMLLIRLGAAGSGSIRLNLATHEIEHLQTLAESVSHLQLQQLLDVLLLSEHQMRRASHLRLAFEMVILKMMQLKPALPIDLLIDKLEGLRESIGGQENRICMAAGARPETKEVAPQPDVAAIDAAGVSSSEVSGSGLPRQAVSDQAPDAGSADNAISHDATDAAPVKQTAEPPPASIDNKAVWAQLLETIELEAPALAAALGNSILKKIDAQSLEIEINGSDFNYKLLQRPKNLARFRALCAAHFGRELDIRIAPGQHGQITRKTGKGRRDQLKQDALRHPLVSDTVEIFEGRILDVKLKEEES